MKSILILLSLLSGSLHAAVQTVTPKDATAGVDMPPPTALQKQMPMSSYMMITPQMRAADYQQAYDLLRKEKSPGKVYFQLADGTTIANVIDMTLMPNASLILFRYNSNQGVKFQVVKVEEITNINYY